MPLIGVLAFQGGFAKHQQALAALGTDTLLVRTAGDLARVDGIVIPGGESTTIGKLLHAFDVAEPLAQRIRSGMPVFGTCAGLILLSQPVPTQNQNALGLLDLEVERNAYGKQVDSFESDLVVPVIGAETFRGVFIRAPIIRAVGSGLQILAEFEQHPVLVRSANILGASFHPELTDDRRIHGYFLSFFA